MDNPINPCKKQVGHVLARAKKTNDGTYTKCQATTTWYLNAGNSLKSRDKDPVRSSIRLPSNSKVCPYGPVAPLIQNADRLIQSVEMYLTPSAILGRHKILARPKRPRCCQCLSSMWVIRGAKMAHGPDAGKTPDPTQTLV